MAELKPYKGGYYLWLYVPSIPAAAIFTVLFALATGYISWRMIKSRAWFCTVLIIGGLCMSSLRLGFIPRPPDYPPNALVT